MLSHMLRASTQRFGNQITLIGSTSAQLTTAALTITLNKPSNVIAGDILVFLGGYDQSGGTGPVWSGPSGWTNVSTPYGRGVLYYTAGFSEPNTYTFTCTTSPANRLSGFLIAFRNAAWDLLGTWTNPAASVIVAPAITLSSNNSTVIGFWSISTVASATFTTPTNYTSLIADSNATAPSMAAFYRQGLAAGSTGTVSSTVSSGTNGRAALIGLKPV